MTDIRCDQEKRDDEGGTLPSADLPASKIKQVRIRYSPEAPKGDVRRKIHPRPPYPAVPEGEEVPDRNPTPPAKIEPPAKP